MKVLRTHKYVSHESPRDPELKADVEYTLAIVRYGSYLLTGMHTSLALFHFAHSEFLNTSPCRYGYYFAATFGFRSAAIKPLITLSQMTQFLSFISQVCQTLIPRFSCVRVVDSCGEYVEKQTPVICYPASLVAGLLVLAPHPSSCCPIMIAHLFSNEINEPCKVCSQSTQSQTLLIVRFIIPCVLRRVCGFFSSRSATSPGSRPTCCWSSVFYSSSSSLTSLDKHMEARAVRREVQRLPAPRRKGKPSEEIQTWKRLCRLLCTSVMCFC